MNCRDFLAEFEERNNALSQPAQFHLNDCPDCVKTSGEQMRVWQMIDNLPRVDAPNDFDFRVKAQIAKSKPADFQPRFFPVLRYVLPLGLVALVEIMRRYRSPITNYIFRFLNDYEEAVDLAQETFVRT